MKNALGTKEDLELFNKAGQRVYRYYRNLKSSSHVCTYDERGNQLTYKTSEGCSWEKTYNERGNVLTYKNAVGYSHERTYDESGNELTFKNSDGVRRGFDMPEFAMEELVVMLGNFKIKK